MTIFAIKSRETNSSRNQQFAISRSLQESRRENLCFMRNTYATYGRINYYLCPQKHNYRPTLY